MESPITLSAKNKEELNHLIDEKLKQGYLIKDGMQKGVDGEITQLMVIPNNIDSEMTLKGGVKLLIGGTLYACLLYFIL